MCAPAKTAYGTIHRVTVRSFLHILVEMLVTRVRLTSLFLSWALLSAPSVHASDKCEDQIDRELHALIESDDRGVLSEQLQLTTIKLALEAKKANRVNVDEYVKSEYKRMGSLDEKGLRDKLENLYANKQLPIDTKKLEERLKNANETSIRFKNNELSLYVLAHQTIHPDSKTYNRMDAAILWYQGKLAEKSKSSSGSAESNLLTASTMAGYYMNLVPKEEWTVSELEQRLAYFKNTVTNSFKNLSRDLIAKIDPACKKEMPCFDCSTSPESLEDRLSSWMLGTKRLIEIATKPGEKTLSVDQENLARLRRVAGITVSTTVQSKPIDETLENVTYLRRVTGLTSATTSNTKPDEPTATPTPVRGPLTPPHSYDVKTKGREIYRVAAARMHPKYPLNPEVFDRAYRGWNKIKSEKGCGNRVMVVDFDQSDKVPRAYLVDMTTGELVLQSYTSHGSGSDKNNDGYAETFSNKSGTYQTSLGFYKIKDKNWATNRKPPPSFTEYGPVLLTEGLDKTLNSNATTRALYVHGEPSSYRFRSYGCFVFGSKKYREEHDIRYAIDPYDRTIQEVRDNMDNGDLIYAHSSLTDTQNLDRDSKWLN